MADLQNLATSMNDHSHPVLTIHCQHIQQNFRHLCQTLSPAAIGCVVKANAYGVGIAIATTLQAAGCNIFFVATPEEGQDLRHLLGATATIYVLHGLTVEHLDVYHQQQLIPILNTGTMLKRWAQEAKLKGHPLPAILQVETGLYRLGLDERDLITMKKEGWDQQFTIHYLMSHLAFGRDYDHPANRQQNERLLDLQRTYFPGISLTLSASGSMVLPPPMHHQLIRVGLSLYGAFSPHKLPQNPLRFPLSLKARIIQLKGIPAGQGIGYGLTDAADHPRRIATVGIGYADGLTQTLSTKGASFYYQGQPLPIVGVVSMDLVMIDITALKENTLQPLDWVDVFYDNMSLYKLAKAADSSQHEILARLGKRVIRDYR